MDQNNQPQNIRLTPLEPVWGVPVVRTHVPITVRNRLLQERLRLQPRTFVSQTKMLIGETTKRLVVGVHVFCPCFVGNSHVRVSVVAPVRLDLMQGYFYNSKPWLFFRFSFFEKPVRSIGLGDHLSLIHDDLRFETVLFSFSEDVHCFIKKDTSLKKKSQDLDNSRFKTNNVFNSKTLENSKYLPIKLVSNEIVASEKTIHSLPIIGFSFLNLLFFTFWSLC
jgi:hypothetical protein